LNPPPHTHTHTPQAAPPQPTDSSVIISKTPALEVWVLPYGGWSSAAMEREKSGELMKKLDTAKESYSTAPYYTAVRSLVVCVLLCAATSSVCV
jgi:hypothetical protein